MVSSSRPDVRRGDVWVVGLEPVVGSEQAKTRPCVVVQRDAANRSGRTTIVVPVTDAKNKPVDTIRPLLRAGEGGLTKDSIALCRQVRVVDYLRLTKRLGTLPAKSAAAVSRGLIQILDLEMDE
jgi:mRNA interferase MazF